MKRIVTVQETVPLTREAIWQYLIDVPSYPKYMGFVKWVKLFGPVAPQTKWYDLSTVLYVPGLYLHIIEAVTERQQIQFFIPLPFGGEMREVVSLTEIDAQTTQVTGTITFILRPTLVDTIFGNFLSNRVRKLMEISVSNIKRIAIPTINSVH